VVSHSFAFSASRRLSTLVSMLELSPPLPVLLLLRVGRLSRLNTRALFAPVSNTLPARSSRFTLNALKEIFINHPSSGGINDGSVGTATGCRAEIYFQVRTRHFPVL
jgi:hypothetical protein